MEKVAAIIQSRTGSVRLPEKSLMPIEGLPMTEHIINRIKKTGIFDHIIMAIPEGTAEQKLIDLAIRLKVDFFQGPENDVLKRFVLTGDSVDADHALRVCGDNPLIDLELMKELAQAHLKDKADYTITPDIIPLGTGTEMVRLNALKKIMNQTQDNRYREHVTTWFHDHPKEFSISNIPAPWYLRNINLRLTVDTEKDFELIALIYGKFYNEPETIVDLEKVIHFLSLHPEIASHNLHVQQKDWRK